MEQPPVAAVSADVAAAQSEQKKVELHVVPTALLVLALALLDMLPAALPNSLI